MSNFFVKAAVVQAAPIVFDTPLPRCSLDGGIEARGDRTFRDR
jgi:hypothetical protein